MIFRMSLSGCSACFDSNVHVLNININVVFREQLLGHLSMYIKSLKNDFSTNAGNAPSKGKNMPEVVNLMVYVRQLEAKVRKI